MLTSVGKIECRQLKTQQTFKSGKILGLAPVFVLALLIVILLLPEATGKTAVKTAGTSHTVMMGFSPYQMMVHPVRIGLATRTSALRVAVWQPGAVFVDNMPIFALKPGMVYSITPGKITEIATGLSMALPYDKRATLAAPDYRIWTVNRWWRGSIEIINTGGAITAVNVLDLEDYLLGVVPSEMPSSWHIEALKAQAVAARSYAWAHLGTGSKWRSDGYDLKPDVSDQAYKGLAAEATSTYHAVRGTTSLVLKDSGKVKPGFYRATVGTTNDENFNIRSSRVPQSTLERITGVKNIVGVTVRQWDPVGNAVRVQIMGAKESKEVYGIALAKMLNFATAAILDVNEDGNCWKFTYRGTGNGARGLSQNGAQALAKRGWLFHQILQQYYQDPDGKLRLDFIEGPRSMYAFRPPAKTNAKAKSPGYSKGPLIEQDAPAPEITADKNAGTGSSGSSASTGSIYGNGNSASGSSGMTKDDTAFTP